MRNLKIGTTCQDFIDAFGLEEGLKRVKACGFDCVDFSLMQNQDNENCLMMQDKETLISYCKRVKTAVREASLTIFQTHAPYYLYNDPEEYLDEKFCLRYINSIKATAWLGAKYVVMHPVLVREGQESHYTDGDSFQKAIAYNEKFFSYLKPYALQYGVTIAIENVCGTNSLRYRGIPGAFTTAEKFHVLLDKLGDGFCVCLDTGHAYYSAESPAHFARKLGDKLQVLHVHDNDGRLDLHIAPTFGDIDWADFIKALDEISYGGAFSLETKYTHFTKDEKHLTALGALHFAIAKNLLQGGNGNV